MRLVLSRAIAPVISGRFAVLLLSPHCPLWGIRRDRFPGIGEALMSHSFQIIAGARAVAPGGLLSGDTPDPERSARVTQAEAGYFFVQRDRIF